MKKILLLMAVLLLSSVFLCTPAMSVPVLQLDVVGGTYSDGTIVAQDSNFTLVALLNDPSLVLETFYVSAALVPLNPVVAAPASLGSFTFNGSQINVTKDMSYGTPPIWEAAGDLETHGIFPTYYSQFSFAFSGDRVKEYDTQTKTGTFNPGNIPGATDKYLFWETFVVDTTGLASNYIIHFDLYTYFLKDPSKIAKGYTIVNAPYSHDASSPVPEPATMLLFGSGLLGLAVFGRRKLFKSA